MEQVLILGGSRPIDLQNKINDWIAANHGLLRILDIKYNHSHGSNFSTYSAMIIYEKKNSN